MLAGIHKMPKDDRYLLFDSLRMRVHEVDHLPHRFAFGKLFVLARLHQSEPAAVGRIVFQHIQRKALSDTLFHGIPAPRQ